MFLIDTLSKGLGDFIEYVFVFFDSLTNGNLRCENSFEIDTLLSQHFLCISLVNICWSKSTGHFIKRPYCQNELLKVSINKEFHCFFDQISVMDDIKD